MTLNLTIPQQMHTDFSPRIAVIGVGGGGTNAVNNMITLNLQGVEFVVANTDAQQLVHSRADRRIQLGPHITQGLGAGAKPEIGRAAAEEAADELARHLDGVHMVFITAGMGGGTGTGAAPVIARMARERNILTVGVVTKPFAFEGSRRARAADQGIEELQHYVDTLIVIPNQNLFRMANERTSYREAFKMADTVLYMGVRGVTDLMMMPGLVNLDFADIRTVMAEMGKAMMGTGEADGENRAIRAAEAAISNPLLEDTSMAGARGLLINITGGEDMTLFEVDQAANRVREEVDEDANIIFGSAIDETLNGKIRVSVVATGIDTPARAEPVRPRLVAVGGAAPEAEPEAATMAAEPALSAAMAETTMAERGMAERGMAAAAVPPPVPRQQQPAAHHATAHHAAAPSRGLFSMADRAATPPSVLPAPAYAHSPAAHAQAGHAVPRQSLFRQVTDTLRRGAPALRPAALASGAPASGMRGHETAGRRNEPLLREPAAEPVRVSVRQAAGEEMGLDIPAFLRRQTS